MTAKEHYENHLANFYSWMIGDFDEKMNAFKSFCVQREIKPFSSTVAIDLGAGTGIQSLALASLGFEVLAIDFNDKLLEELEARGKDYRIQFIKDDIRVSSMYIDKHPELVVCAGDTITHLDSIGEVNQLLKDIYSALVSEGRIVISFRDYSNELKDTSRFIPVKNDPNKILTCFLEYFDSKVRVTDIFHERIEAKWHQKISSYEKLRIPKIDFSKMLIGCGFNITFESMENGMLTFIGQKL
jgi:SAM-dependent methyltransferase